mgnify:CR=1 FL=1
MRGLVVVGLVLVALGAASSTDPRPVEPVRAIEGPVALLGESYAVGLEPELGRLARGLGLELLPFGEVGQHVEGLRRTIPRARAQGARMAIVVSGGNDYGRSDSANVAAQIRAAVAELEGLTIWYVSPPTTPFPDRSGALASWIDALGGRAWLDSRGRALERAAGDKLAHPSGQGYRDWAYRIWSFILEGAPS